MSISSTASTPHSNANCKNTVGYAYAAMMTSAPVCLTDGRTPGIRTKNKQKQVLIPRAPYLHAPKSSGANREAIVLKARRAQCENIISRTEVSDHVCIHGKTIDNFLELRAAPDMPPRSEYWQIGMGLRVDRSDNFRGHVIAVGMDRPDFFTGKMLIDLLDFKRGDVILADQEIFWDRSSFLFSDIPQENWITIPSGSTRSCKDLVYAESARDAEIGKAVRLVFRNLVPGAFVANSDGTDDERNRESRALDLISEYSFHSRIMMWQMIENAFPEKVTARPSLFGHPETQLTYLRQYRNLVKPAVQEKVDEQMKRVDEAIAHFNAMTEKVRLERRDQAASYASSYKNSNRGVLLICLSQTIVDIAPAVYRNNDVVAIPYDAGWPGSRLILPDPERT